MTSCQPNLENLVPLCSCLGFHISFLHSLGSGLWCAWFEDHPRQLKVHGHEAARGDVVEDGGETIGEGDSRDIHLGGLRMASKYELNNE